MDIAVNRKATRTDYRDRIERVSAHIRANLDKPLNLDELAEIACLSRFHWHRIYRGALGETVWQTVRRLRLHRAAFELSNGEAPLASIAKRAGYATVRAFARAFREDFGLPPQRYRAEGGHRRYDNPRWKEDQTMYDIRISEEDPVTLVGVPHKGSYMEINAAFGRLSATLAGMNGAAPKTGWMAGVYFDDPDVTPQDELNSLAALSLEGEQPVPEGLARFDLPGGRYAVLVHKGPYAELGKAYAFLFGKWLPDSGETPRPVPAVERYLNTPADTAPKDLRTEVMIALEDA